MWEAVKNSGKVFYETRTAPSLKHLWQTRQPVVWALSIAIGLIGAYAVLAFVYAIGLAQWLWIGYEAENVTITILSSKPAWQIIAGPTIGGIVVGLLLAFVAPGRRAHGLSDVIAARAVEDAHLPLKTGLFSALISAVSLGAGASAGREGPAVHLGATIACLLGCKFKLPFAARRVLLACGAAAAVSASFNAPIAGVIFAHEVILRHYAISALTPIIISSVIATTITRYYHGNSPTFAIPEYFINSNWEFPAFVLLGLVCGLVAAGLQSSIARADQTARSIPVPIWVRPVIGGLAIGILAVFIPEIVGVGYEVTNLALREKYTLGFLFVLLLAKTLAVAITLASRFGGGIFSPALYLGAVSGGAFGLLAATALPDLASGSGVYSIVGMGAVAGAVLGAPLSTVLIVFELTRSYEITIALLLAVSVAIVTLKAIFGQSFFSWQLAMRGLFLDHGPHTAIVKTWTVEEFLTPLDPNEKPDLSEFRDRPVLSPQDTLEKAFQVFGKGSYTRIAVYSNDTLIGWADYTEALAEYNKALIAANEEQHR